MLCDEENGYVVHQPGNRCAQCAKNEGRNSMILVVTFFVTLVLLIWVCAKYRLVQQLTATSNVIITGGEHKGLIGTILSKQSDLKRHAHYEVKLNPPAATSTPSLTVSGAQLGLIRIDIQEEYQKRLMKIKLFVQFVTICTRLSATYNVPFPPLTTSFLNNLEFLEFLDISGLPMNLECWRSFDYIGKVYVHTLMVLSVMVLLKPGAILRLAMMPFRLIQALVPSKAISNRLTSLAFVQKGKQRVASMNAVVRRQSERFGEKVSTRIHTPSSEGKDDARPLLNEESAALVIQRSWRCMNPRAQRARHNIFILREKLLSFVQKSKGLTTEDFFLLFTYTVYTGISDTCFMYFDCTEFEDGETYLMADPSIKCTDSYYQDSVWYVALMGVLLPFGIPCYYSYALYCNRGVVNPVLKKVLKDKDYVQAFACAGVSFLGPDGEKLKGDALVGAQHTAINEWKAANPALYKSLEGKDYESQFQQKLEQAGFKKAKSWITLRARGVNIPARRFKFLWGEWAPSIASADSAVDPYIV
jgi:hypothetical protein